MEEKRLYPTLIRVAWTENDPTDLNRWTYAVIPSWNPRELVRIETETLPNSIRSKLSESGFCFYADVNVDAESYRELEITNFRLE